MGNTIFISYSRKDADFVYRLAGDLEKAGLSIWLDRSIAPSSKWRAEIFKAIEECGAFLVVLSPNSMASREVIRELELGDSKSRRLVPLMYQSCELPPEAGYVLSGIQWLEFTKGNYQENLVRLLAQLSDLRVPKPEQKEAPPASQPELKGRPLVKEAVRRRRLKLGPRLSIETPIATTLLHVPAGPFTMGSDKAQDRKALDGELPSHTVCLPDYYISQYPISNAEYEVFCREIGHVKPAHWKNGEIPRGLEKHPVVNVTWYDAAGFCDWLSERTGWPVCLPAEPEWEKAARGTDGRIYPWGNKFAKDGCHSSATVVDIFARWGTCEVGIHSPAGDSPYGASDMSGNVWEWCRSVLAPYPYRDTDLRDSPDLTGPRVLRGGSFMCSPYDVRCASRYKAHPTEVKRDAGFRIVVETTDDRP